MATTADNPPPVVNFRRVAGTKLYRSSDLNTASEDQIRAMLALGIRTVVDLRATAELHGKKDSPLDNHFVQLRTSDNSQYYTVDDAARQDILTQANNENCKRRTGLHYYCDFLDLSTMKQMYRHSPWYWKPFFAFLLLIDILLGDVTVSLLMLIYRLNYGGGLRQHMIDMVEMAGPSIAEALRLISAPGNCPAVAMCSAGKDRTGLVSAFTQIVCDVDRETVIADYAQSDTEWEPHRERLLAKMRPFRVNRQMAYSPPEVMRQVLEHLDNKYGSVPAYLESIGFCSLMQAKLLLNVRAD